MIFSSSYDVVSPRSNVNTSPYNGVSPRNGISPPNGMIPQNGVSIVLGSPSTGSTLLGHNGMNGRNNGVGIGKLSLFFENLCYLMIT